MVVTKHFAKIYSTLQIHLYLQVMPLAYHQGLAPRAHGIWLCE